MRRRAHLFLIAVLTGASLAACGGGGLAPLTPGIGGTQSVAPTPTPKPSSPPNIGGTPIFTGGGTGDCTQGITFDAAGQSAAITITEPNFTGPWTVASNTQPSVVSVTISGATLTIQALAAGQAYFTVSDPFGNSSGCNVGVTTSGGSIQ